jgi:hypothetical protein
MEGLDMVWRTMQEWNLKGKVVTKGSKCLLRDPQGICLFNQDQVEKSRERQTYQTTSRKSSTGYYAQQGGNYQKHDYDYDDYDFQ